MVNEGVLYVFNINDKIVNDSFGIWDINIFGFLVFDI